MRISDWSSDVCSSDLDPSAPTSTEDSGTVRTVRRGDTASKIIIEVYGNFSPGLLRLVEEANPQIADLNILDSGDRLNLPSIGDRQPSRVVPADGERRPRPRRAGRHAVDYERKSAVWGRRVAVRVNLGGGRLIKK